MTELLNENSLYSDAAGRAAIVADKQLAMDAMCFSLLGFLGCYQLAQNRAFLKTYERTEGKLQLQSIGDANHDVSLSVKLAEEAGAIPQSAAMNVTKLLYKIKSKQVRGTLNEDLVRSLIKTCRISSNRPAGMIYNVVNQFETGAIGLGELAKKLYNLSKLPNFKAVSGEFRQLVMKGQYQELFSKLPTNNVQPQPVSAVSTQVTPVVQPVVTTPVVTSQPRQLTAMGFVGVSDDELLPLFKMMLQTIDMTWAVMRDKIIAFCKKNKIVLTTDTQNVANVATGSLIKFMHAKVDQNDWTYLGQTPMNVPKWLSQTNTSYSSSPSLIKNLLWCYTYAGMRSELLSGRYKTFNEVMFRMPKQYVNTRGTWTTWFPQFKDNNESFLMKVISPDHFWDNYDTSRNFSSTMQSICETVEKACRGAGSVTFPKLPMTLELWTLLNNTIMNYSSRTITGVFGVGYDNVDMAVLLTKLLKLEHSNIGVSLEGKVFVVTTDIEYFKSSNEFSKLKILKDRGLVEFVNTLDAFGTMTDAVARSAKNSSNFWDSLVQASQRAFNNTNIIRSEKFINWMVEQFDNNQLDRKLLTPDSLNYFITSAESKLLMYNVMSELFSKSSFEVSFVDWCRLFNLVNSDGVNKNDPATAKLLAEIFKARVRRFTDFDKGFGVIRGFDVSVAVELVVRALESNDINPSALPISVWKHIVLSNLQPEDMKTVARLMPDSIVPTIAAETGGVWRSTLISENKTFRTKVFSDWKINTENSSNAFASLMNFLNYKCGGFWLDEKLVPDNIKALVLKCVESFRGDMSITYNDIDGRDVKNKIPAWIDKPLRAVLLDNTKSTVSTSTVANADRLMTRADFNNYMDAIPTDKIATTLKTTTYSDSIAFSAILEKMAHNPSDYNVNTMLKLAYAMHVGYKAQTGPDASKMIDKSQIDSAYANLCEALNNLIGAGKYDEVNKVYDSLSFAPDLKTKILDWFRKSALLRNSLNSVKSDEIHALVDVDPKRMNQLMRFNNIKFPTSGIRVTKTTKLSDIAKLSGTFDLEPLKTSDENLDQKALDRRTAEFDVFNKYRHGNIGIKFLRSFNVAIPSQIEANKIWNEAHPNDTVMDPVFHGTGSVAATFVLRYGFAVISASDSSVVGRMLGNGIYFSNVLDKCGQYVSDSGYSRGVGRKGYVFQMKANLGKEGVDYKAQAAGLVSPEWCVFHPNDQLNIYKAHFVELVDKPEIDKIKQRVGLNEEFFKVEQFKQYLSEAQTPENKGCVSYTFMDGTIPISDSVVVDFEQFDPTEYGSHVTMAPSGLGPVIYIQVDDPTINEIYAVRYTVRFMSRGADLQRFKDLLAKRPVVPLNTSANTVENS